MKRVSFFFLGFFFAGADLGAQVEDGFYVGLDAGLSLIDDYVDSGFGMGVTTVSPENGANFGGAIGYRFLDHYRGEINVSHRKADIRQVNGDVDLTSFVANLYYDFDYSSDLRPYLGLGAGRTDGPDEPS